MQTELLLQLEGEEDLQPIYERVAKDPDIVCGFAMFRPDNPGIDVWLFRFAVESILPMQMIVGQQIAGSSSLYYFSRMIDGDQFLDRGEVLLAKFRPEGSYRTFRWSEWGGWSNTEESLPFLDGLGDVVESMIEQSPLSLPIYQSRQEMDVQWILMGAPSPFSLSNERAISALVKSLHHWTCSKLTEQKFPELALFGMGMPQFDLDIVPKQVRNSLPVNTELRASVVFVRGYAGITTFMDDMLRVCSNAPWLWMGWGKGLDIELFIADSECRRLYRGRCDAPMKIQPESADCFELFDLGLIDTWQEHQRLRSL